MERIQKAYKELWEILKLVPQKEYKKISPQFIEVIEKNMDKEYIYEVKHIKDFENQKMMEETKALLAILYRDYWASLDEKEEIIKNEKEEFNRNNNILKQKYNTQDLFKNKKIKIEQDKTEIDEDTSLVIVNNEKWYMKMFNIIKKLLRK